MKISRRSVLVCRGFGPGDSDGDGDSGSNPDSGPDDDMGSDGTGDNPSDD